MGYNKCKFKCIRWYICHYVGIYLFHYYRFSKLLKIDILVKDTWKEYSRKWNYFREPHVHVVNFRRSGGKRRRKKFEIKRLRLVLHFSWAHFSKFGQLVTFWQNEGFDHFNNFIFIDEKCSFTIERLLDKWSLSSKCYDKWNKVC